jgi:RNA polymerase sigma factor (TIGR02999 family)
MSARTEITQTLIEIRDADDETGTRRLAEALYPELRRVAGALFRRERREHTLQPTALVGEAFLKLVDQSRVDWRDRTHFLNAAARVMRQVLVDHARRRSAVKRGMGGQRVTLQDDMIESEDRHVDVLVLNEALGRLAAVDPRCARAAELRIFAGLTIQEAAEVLGVSKRTADDDWAMARMWLARELKR